MYLGGARAGRDCCHILRQESSSVFPTHLDRDGEQGQREEAETDKEAGVDQHDDLCAQNSLIKASHDVTCHC